MKTLQGVIKLDHRHIRELSRDLVSEFETCGYQKGERLVIPPQEMEPVKIKVSTSDGEKRQVGVHVASSHFSTQYPADHHSRGEYVQSRIDYGDGNSHTERHIFVWLRNDRCATREEWVNTVNSTLVHEIAHAADPNVSLRFVKQKSYAKGTFCAYVSRPTEVVARLAQVKEELRTSFARDGVRVACARGELPGPAALLEWSQTWRDVKHCLAEAQRRKFMRLAADLWERRRYGRCTKQGS